MPDKTSHDDALLARLNALKKSSVSFDTSLSSSITPSNTHTPPPTNAPNDLAARFARLGSASPSSSPKPSRSTSTDDAQKEGAPVIAPGAPSYLEGIAEGVGGVGTEANAEDGRSLEELLGELGPREEWDLSREERKGVGSMLREIRTILPEVRRGREVKRQGGEKEGEELTDWENVEVDIGKEGVRVGHAQEQSGGHDDDADEVEGEGEKKKTEDEETDDVIARIMAELEVSRKYDPPSPPPEDDKISNPEETHTPTKENPPDSNDLTLPSAPTSLPSPSPSQTLAIEDALSARLSALSHPQTDALGLPSAPSFAPARKPPTVQSSFAKEPDDEVDSWCIICNDDATLKCTGCDGDLYCQTCWMEGHRGESAGWEERRHKAVLYSKDGGGGKKRRKEAAA